MKTTHLILALGMSLLLSSCNFNFGQEGNGNVTTEERPVTENFNEIKGSAGLDIYLTQGDQNKITVEADENLHQYILTDIKNGKLTIKTSGNIGRSKATKVYVTFIDVKKIESSSGADVVGNSLIKSEVLSLSSSSGSEMSLEVLSKELSAQTSSGAELELTGKASSFSGKASSGSELDAKELLTLNSIAEASSGAEITINVKEKLNANASSGGDIAYYGNPTSVNVNKSSSGRVKKE